MAASIGESSLQQSVFIPQPSNGLAKHHSIRIGAYPRGLFSRLGCQASFLRLSCTVLKSDGSAGL